ncbi:MAG: hypothetical protein AAF211_12245 [Myxococcota bacterium]
MVTLTPTVRWPLLAAVEVELPVGLRDQDGREIRIPRSLFVPTRAPEYTGLITLREQLADAVVSVPSVNRSGDVLWSLTFSDEASRTGVQVTLYDAVSQQFVPRIVQEPISVGSLGASGTITDDGRVMAMWALAAPEEIRAYESVGGGSWQPLASLDDGSFFDRAPLVGLGDSGLAVAASNIGDFNTSDANYLDLDDTRGWSSADSLLTADRIIGVEPVGNDVLVFFENTGDGEIGAKRFSPNTPTNPDSISVASSISARAPRFKRVPDDGAVGVWQNDQTGTLQTATYDNDRGAFEVEEFGAASTGGDLCLNTAGDRLVVWDDRGSTMARYARSGEDWGPTEMVGISGASVAPSCVLDEAGNGYAFYATPEGDAMTISVLLPSSNWQPFDTLEFIPARVTLTAADSFGALSVFVAQAETAWVYRFE